MSKRTAGWGGRRTGILLLVIGTASLTSVSGAPAWAESRGGCVSVSVDAPIRLPGGGLHPPGKLTLCDSMEFSPVSTLHKTYLDGQPVAMLIGRRTASEAGREISPVVFFHRDRQGRLELFGYVLPHSGRSVTYVLGDKTKVSQQSASLASLSPESRQLVAVAAGPR